MEKVRCQSYPDRRYIPGWLLSTAKPGKTRTLTPCDSARMVSLFYPSHAGCLATLLALSPVSLPTKYCCPSFIKTVPLPAGTPFPLMDPPYLPTAHSIPQTYCPSSNKRSSSSISLKPGIISNTSSPSCPQGVHYPARLTTTLTAPSFCPVTALVGHTS